MSFLRFVVVWLAALTIASAIAGKDGGFVVIFTTYGFLMTLPAIIAFAAAAVIEKLLEKKIGKFSALSGVLVGATVPLTLYLIAPNKQNALSGMVFIAPISVGAGLLWSVSYFLVPRRKQDHA